MSKLVLFLFVFALFVCYVSAYAADPGVKLQADETVRVAREASALPDPGIVISSIFTRKTFQEPILRPLGTKNFTRDSGAYLFLFLFHLDSKISQYLEP
ncbi:hypothetical protein G9C98_001902 [Cotesia typhae]|uniref:Uncharacterized protein n=1 Tax=Cotesia typhae TaxID=2053667 RepID=A0A8J5RIW4_9HYME|nr:hypothetical protein G9C98_001902 [Cotesia typhae]